MPVLLTNQQAYQDSVRDDVRQCIEEKNCRPILFLGSGFSQRYFGLPNWNGLLKILCEANPQIDHAFPYHLQKHDQDPMAVAEDFARHFLEWGWSDDGRLHFPEACYDTDAKPQGFIKSYVANFLREQMRLFHQGDQISPLAEELALLQRIRPFAVITTNYDSGAELVFPDYNVIVGEKILRADTNNLGDILKIHGCVSDPDSIVLTQSDYAGYRKKRKYLSAKLLAYFAEHPLVFVGYSVSDPNIHEILTDIDEVLACNGEQVPNLYMVSYKEPTAGTIADTPIRTSEHHYVRVKEICSREFGWVYDTFCHQAAVDLDVRTLRLLQSQMHQLVRTDAPAGKIAVNYQTLKEVVGSTEGLSNILGICSVNDPAHINATYPYTLNEVGKALGYPSWHKAKDLINAIREYKSIDISSYDNRYHVAIKTGKTAFHKYSHAAVDLLRAVKDKLEYEVKP